MTIELQFQTATELAARIRRREVSAVDVVDALRAQIDRHHAAINAVVTWDDRARDAATAADAAVARGDALGPLHGVPVTIKDSLETAGLRTTAGVPVFANHVPARDATAVARLRRAGAIVVGKTNLPPFASQPQTDNPIFGRTNNPWDVARTPGGSSGGGVAAVATGMSILDLGSDASGSIRFPAHFTGVYGFRPTARRVPTAGHIPDPPGGPRLDRYLGTVGPIARSVADLGLAMRGLVADDGDVRDTEAVPVPWRDVAIPDAIDLRIAWAPTLPGVPVGAALRSRAEQVAVMLRAAGARVDEQLPEGLAEHRATWLAFWAGFTHTLRALYPEVPFPPPDTPPPSLADFTRTLAARDQIIGVWDAFFATFDVLLLPVAPCVAFPHSPPRTPLDVDGTPVESWRIDHLLYPFSFTGQPTVVIPAGLDAGGLPIGVQLVGRRFADERLLATAERVDAIVGGYRRPAGF